MLAALPNWHQDQDALLDIPESRELEFKGEPYRLDEGAQKLEFAKDISTMANAGGGLIVLGIATRRDVAVGRDISDAVRPIPEGLVNVGQMLSTAEEWVYPPVRDLEVREWPGPDEKMLVSIRVRPLHETTGLALIRGAETAGGRVVREYLAAGVRSDAGTSYYKHSEIYEWIRRGRATQEAGSEAEPTLTQSIADAMLAEARDRDSDWPVFVIQVWPSQPARLEELGDREGALGVLLDPPVLRRDGFNLGWMSNVQWLYRQDGTLHFSLGTRESLDVTPTGVVTFVGSGGPDLLCWATERVAGEGTLRINPFALIELIYEFARLWQKLSEWLRPTPRVYSFRVALLGAKRKSGLQLSDSDALFVHEAPQDDVFAIADVPSEMMSPEVVTGKLTSNVYAQFRLLELVPFLDASGTLDVRRFTERGLRIE